MSNKKSTQTFKNVQSTKATATKVDNFVEIEIESGITPPYRSSGYIKNWPLEKLKEGQSFFISLEEDQKEGSMRHALNIYARRKGREHNRNYSAHSATKDGIRGFRIFRNAGEYAGPAEDEDEEAQAA